MDFLSLDPVPRTEKSPGEDESRRDGSTGGSSRLTCTEWWT